jgi:hypothetical protein
MIYIKARDTENDTNVTVSVTDLDALIHAGENANLFCEEDDTSSQYCVAKCHIEFLEIISEK